MTVLYSVWNTGEDTAHLAPYYDTSHSKFMWINGRNLPQLEPFSPEECDVPLGLDGTGHTDMIRAG